MSDSGNGRWRLLTSILGAMLGFVMVNTAVSSRAAWAASANARDIERICRTLDSLVASVHSLALETARFAESDDGLGRRMEMLEARSADMQTQIEQLRMWAAAREAGGKGDLHELR